MSQKSIERLRDYLGQLPPQALALLMREFERAMERGDDTGVASVVLEQLRGLTRGAGDNAPRRREDAARLVFRALEPFLVDGSLPVRPGQIRRASLLPVWQWLAREGAPDAVREFETELTRISEDGERRSLEVAVRKLQLATAASIFKIAAPSSDDRQRALARVGPPDVAEDLLPIGSVLHAREALDAFGTRVPSFMRVFGDFADRLRHLITQHSDAADPTVGAFRVDAGDAAAHGAVADYSHRDQDGGLR